MKRGTLTRRLVGIALALVGFAAVTACTTKSASHISSNQDQPTFEEFLAGVYQEPWENGVYIVNGDTPLPTLDHVRRFYHQVYSGAGKLIVHHPGGVDAKWDDQQKLQITYCVSNNFGQNRDAILEAMEEATTNGWEKTSHIDFVHLTDEDDNCDANNQNVVFDIRQVSGQPYLARAFFPDQSRATRNVLVDSSSFAPDLGWPLSGIMAHELGHALGFRHEHTRPESGMCFEDNDWRDLTPYDSTSVMHYPQCNGTGTPLTISSDDTLGAALLYGPPGGESVCGDGICFGDETCDSCADDCGACPVCGDGECNGDETCDSCDSDCGVCPVCGDGSCNGDETCASCEGDCGVCPACAHDKCVSGPALDENCDECVTQICAQDPYCCSTAWDSICVGEVASICGLSCDA